jgi:lysophospholipase L1-like esterase
MSRATPESNVITPAQFPPPIGSHWEVSDGGRYRLVRFTAAWRETIRQLTALRSLEVGVSAWEFVTDSPSLSWVGRWSSRRQNMCRLEVAVDGQVVSSQLLADAQTDETVCLFDGLDGRPHHVQIYFPATTALDLSRVIAGLGAVFTTPLPRRPVWCSWGDSITQGTLCESARESYAQIAARLLGWTPLNRGFGGSGCPDAQTALAIACTEPWDILTIAIGVNDAALGLVEPAEFGLMYQTCLDVIRRRQPSKQVVCISPILCTLQEEAGVAVAARTDRIRDVIRDVVERIECPGIWYINGLDLLAEGDSLVDEIHPGPAGHALMAQRLAQRLAQIHAA